MKTNRYTQIVLTLLVILASGVVRAWAVDVNSIHINPTTGGSITINSVEEQTGSDYKVTITASINEGYEIKKKDFVVEPVTDPSLSRQRQAPGIAATLEVEDGTSANEFYFILPARYSGAIVTANFSTTGPIDINNLGDIKNPSGNYRFSSGFSASGTPADNIGSATNPFKGKIDGNFVEISLGNDPLFNTVDGAIIKNVIISSASTTTNGHAGAIACVAKGDTRIYNCGILSGTISGSGYVGGIVGFLDGNSRVINCYSYANIAAGGTDKGGIVGYNNYASKHNDIRTMVMNCMFYGTIATGGNVSPVYGGENIDNLKVSDTELGLNTYNYYRYESNKKNITSGKYNCALAAKEKYLVHFELYRQLLNSNRKLAAWYAVNDASKGVGENNEMAKWVLDRSIAPYPILKKQGYYSSVINYDPEKYYDASGTEVQRSTVTERNKGKILGELTINVSAGSHGSIKSGKEQIKLKRIDKDFDNYNYNYDKVQLPYFNEVGDGNYTTDGWVVTGWKVTVSGGSNSYTDNESDNGSDVTYNSEGKVTQTRYNFADRNCTGKDNYSTSTRVFSQGAYFDVPYGVDEISIEAYWGKAAYICDKYYDVVYTTEYNGGKDVIDMGMQGNNLLPGGQTIYTSITGNTGALASLTGITNPTVYDYALVLVGNLHLNSVPSNGDKPFTIMSADFDNDNEPDYSLIYTHPGRSNGAVSPIRFDFINVPGMAMAQKPNGATKFLNVSIFKPKGWFEVTNTCLITVTQFEYDNGGKASATTSAPVILLGGEYEQFVSTQSTNICADGYKDRTSYIHIGSNAWFKEFNNGTHSDGYYATKHIPVSVTGGYYEKFYLSGAYRPDAQVAEDDAEGYISGGKFDEVAGAGQQQIDGNVYWQIYDADITDFYGGGVNYDKPITGNITVDIFNSHVTTYCGGPKFGDMQKKGTVTIKQAGDPSSREKNIDKDRTVTTNATGCVFGDYFGAGYGGISFVRRRTQDATAYDFSTWVSQYTNNKGKYFDGTTTRIGDTSKGEKAGPGVAVDFDYEFFVWSTGETGGRFYIKYASLSFAKTNDVNSTLNDCHITHNFYGGGHLGKVDGNVTSALNGCTIDGEVFGAGYSANRPTVPYRNGGFTVDGVPDIDTNAGVFADGEKVAITDDDYLTLEPGKTLTNNTKALGSGTMYTDYTEAQLNSLGTVAGKVTLTIDNYTVNNITKETSITGNVYGGGESSDVYGVNSSSVVTSEVEINVKGGSMPDVYGGGKGKTTVVGGDVTVNIGKLEGSTYKGDATISGSVYGGSALGAVNAKKDGDWDKESNPDDLLAIDGKETKVNILKGTVNGSVFGGGLGDLATLGTGHADIAAKVFGDVTVTVGAATSSAATTVPIIEGSVYGGSNVNGILEKAARLNVISGTIGTETTSGNNTVISGGNVHGGGFGQPTLVIGSVEVTIGERTGTSPNYAYSGYATIKGDVYGGSAMGNVNTADKTSATTDAVTNVNLYGCASVNNIYGGGLGDNTPDNEVAANVYGPVTVTVEGGKAGNVFGCNNKYGTPKSTVVVLVNGTDATDVNSESGAKTYALQGVYGGGNLAHYDPTTPGNYPTVTVNGCETSIKDVFGGGNAAAVPYTSVTINGGDIDRVFAGGNGTSGAANVGYKNSEETPTAGEDEYGTGTSNAIIAGGTINEIYGGSNNKGTVRATGTMSIAKSTAAGACPMKIGSVYGGGNQAPGAAVALTIGCTGTGDDEGITNVFGGANAANVTGNILLTITEGKIANVFGGNNSSGTVSGTITVNINKAASPCVWNIGNVFGGGKDAAYSTSNIPAGLTELDYDDNTAANYYQNFPVVNIKNGTVGNVFGGGQGSGATVTGNPQVTIGDATDGYEADVTGDVYGGGDAAAVVGTPAVHVINKDNTIIGNVYGGGNAADVSATSVTIDGGTIGMVFGGGHGDKNSDPQKAANVTGDVGVTVAGGTITKVFGGSNSKGNIGGAITLGIAKSTATGASDLKIGEVYGGGNEAAGNAGTITIGCTGTWTDSGEKNHTNANATDNRIGYELEGIGTVYGGANAANVGNDITLNITGGIVENVFGGNNTSGSIDGDITVNIEKGDATCSWYVGNVYGGGNLAAYSQKNAGHPAVNVKNGIVSGNVYGGGKGSTAVVTGNPVVTIGDATATHVAIVTGDVYGGGDAAAVTGNTTVTYNDNNTSSTVARLFGGGNAAGVSGTSTVTMTLGKVTGGVYGGCNSSGSVGNVTIALNGGQVGTDATHRADVYGGGYGHPTTTTGDITVNIGTATTSEGATTYSGSAVIYGDVYGGSALGQVNGSGSLTTLNINSNSIHGTIYGGGMGSGTGDDTKATTNGNIQINYNTANTDLAGLYGGANANGNVVGNIEVNMKANIGASGAGNGIDLFGGGLGAATSTNGNVTVNIGDLTLNSSNNPVYTPVVYGNIYGGSSLGSVNDAVTDLTTVNILSGTIHGNTYGGGLGEAGEANVAKGQVNGAVYVNIGSGTVNSETGYATTTDGFATFVAASDGSSGSIYGCNNTNGSPKGNVTVNVYQTAHTTTDEASYTGTDATYAIDQVFGGGNQADYDPTSDASRATVHVYTCDNTIRRVFGGGNAAAAVGVVTRIDGGHFDYVYGGGNGEVTAANIGAGGTNLQIHGGKINYLFGGSNAQGTITGNMGVSVDNNSGCGGTESTQYVNEFFCGNNLASIGTEQNPVNITATIACGTRFGAVYGGCSLAPLYGSVDLTVEGGIMDYVYGGSKGDLASLNDELGETGHTDIRADISGDVKLTIKGGQIKNVFGGSNINGNIDGSIEVNIEKDDASTCNDGWYIGNVYGASNLAAYSPTKAGNTLKVNIKNGTVNGNVYGGGKGATATVTSNPVVTIGDVTNANYAAIVADDEHDKDVNNAAFVGGNVYGGGDAAPVVGSTTVTYNDNSTTTSVANIFGGGNNASVSGNATVTLKGKATVEQNVFGGGNKGIVGGTATVNIQE